LPSSWDQRRRTILSAWRFFAACSDRCDVPRTRRLMTERRRRHGWRTIKKRGAYDLRTRSPSTNIINQLTPQRAEQLLVATSTSSWRSHGRHSATGKKFLRNMRWRKYPRSAQPCIPLGSLNRVPALIGWGKGGNVTSAGWQVTLCDPIWHVSSRSGAVLVAQTAIRFLTVPYCSLPSNNT